MPDQRAAGKSLVGCHVDDIFAAEIDRARGRKSRSDFLREALYDYLKEKHRTTLPASVKYAPDRAGKGGRPKKPTTSSNITQMAAMPQDQSSKVADNVAEPFVSPPPKKTSYRKGLRKKPE